MTIYWLTTPVTTSMLNSSTYTANIKQSIGTLEEFLPLTINSRDTVLSMSRLRAKSMYLGNKYDLTPNILD